MWNLKPVDILGMKAKDELKTNSKIKNISDFYIDSSVFKNVTSLELI